MSRLSRRVADLSRRTFLLGTAATGSLVAMGGIPAFARAKMAGSCSGLHDRISSDLGKFACDPANSVEAVNKALSSAHCPQCGTRLSADLSRHGLSGQRHADERTKAVRYVFSSDSRAGLPGYGILPG